MIANVGEIKLMGKREKLLARLRRIPADFSWSELALVFESCGYEIVQKGGSHCFFVSTKRGDIFHLFRPHGRGENSLPRRILEKAVEHLTRHGEI